MNNKQELIKIFEQLKREGIGPEQEERIRREINGPQGHYLPSNESLLSGEIYSTNYGWPFSLPPPANSSFFPVTAIQTLDDLIKRDEQRETDGFPKKLRIGQIVQPTKSGKKVVIVPTTTEEKFYHDHNYDDDQSDDEGESGGTGEGDEGEVIGEEPLRPQQGEGQGAGDGDGGDHDIESNAYNLGRTLTEKFKLPHLKDKGKKTVLTSVKYDLTDRNRGSGQFLDKKESLREIIKTNRNLGRIQDPDNVDLTKLIVNPKDLIYRVLSLEKVFESQALVFFLRDYSGSMWGKPTEIIVNQHVMIYSWLKYEYNKLVKKRFFLHDTLCKEVPTFSDYYNLTTGGGTMIVSGIKKINDIVEGENLARDYNIYVFYGTDGDDWYTGDKETETIGEFKKMLSYVNRLGITVVRNGWSGGSETTLEKYVNAAGFGDHYPQEFRMDIMNEDADDDRIMEGIRILTDPD